MFPQNPGQKATFFDWLPVFVPTPASTISRYSDTMRNIDSLPDRLVIQKDLPSLEKLPQEVRQRIEDMWRVGGMLSHYVEVSTHAEERRVLLSKSTNLGITTMWKVGSPFFEKEEAKKIEQE